MNRLERMREAVDALVSPTRSAARCCSGSTERDREEPAQQLCHAAARDVDVYAMNRLRASLERARRFDEPDTLDTPGETLAAERPARRRSRTTSRPTSS